MENTINQQSLSQLIQQSKEDPELLEYIHKALLSFSDYHNAVIAEQLYSMVYGGGTGVDPDTYRAERAALDKRRTTAHNAVLANVNLLNRMCTAAGIAPVYNGMVSEDRPYRRYVANAIFEYLTHVIDSRS